MLPVPTSAPRRCAAPTAGRVNKMITGVTYINYQPGYISLDKISIKGK